MERKKPLSKVPQPTEDAARINFKDLQASRTDPQGSYTGCPADPYEVPVQDADDL